MKIISYDPATESAPALLNAELEHNTTDKYVCVIFKHIFEKIKDEKVFIEKYEELLNKFVLSFAMYPYYLHFNRALPNSIKINNPRAIITCSTMNNYKFNIIEQVAHGMLIIDLEKFKKLNYKFDENMKYLFYLQLMFDFAYINHIY